MGRAVGHVTASTDSRRWRRHVRCSTTTENSCTPAASTTARPEVPPPGHVTRAPEAETTSRRVACRRRRADAAAVDDATSADCVSCVDITHTFYK